MIIEMNGNRVNCMLVRRGENGKPRGFMTGSKKCEAYGEGFITLARTGLPYTGKALPPASEDYDILHA